MWCNFEETRDEMKLMKILIKKKNEKKKRRKREKDCDKKKYGIFATKRCQVMAMKWDKGMNSCHFSALRKENNFFLRVRKKGVKSKENCNLKFIWQINFMAKLYCGSGDKQENSFSWIFIFSWAAKTCFFFLFYLLVLNSQRKKKARMKWNLCLWKIFISLVEKKSCTISLLLEWFKDFNQTPKNELKKLNNIASNFKSFDGEWKCCLSFVWMNKLKIFLHVFTNFFVSLKLK